MEHTDTYRDLLTAAIKIAVDRHGDCIGKDGKPYILHPLRLMMKAQTYEEQIVAVLHDTIEDTGLKLTELTAAGFPHVITYALECLTRRRDEDYEQFIERIAVNPLATKVKLLDLYDNIDVTRLPRLGEPELQRTAKYHRAILRLTGTQQPA